MMSLMITKNWSPQIRAAIFIYRHLTTLSRPLIIECNQSEQVTFFCTLMFSKTWLAWATITYILWKGLEEGLFFFYILKHLHHLACYLWSTLFPCHYFFELVWGVDRLITTRKITLYSPAHTVFVKIFLWWLTTRDAIKQRLVFQQLLEPMAS